MHYYDMAHLAHGNQQKRLQEAEAHRLAKTTQQDKQHYPGYAPVLAKLGETLSEIGDTLQVRYSQPSPSPIEICSPAAAGKRG